MNYHDNLKMFVDKQAAKEFNDHMHEQMHFDENASQEISEVNSEENLDSPNSFYEKF